MDVDKRDGHPRRSRGWRCCGAQLARSATRADKIRE
jgi:hypothetical protein